MFKYILNSILRLIKPERWKLKVFYKLDGVNYSHVYTFRSREDAVQSAKNFIEQNGGSVETKPYSNMIYAKDRAIECFVSKTRIWGKELEFDNMVSPEIDKEVAC